jgi:lysophospholipase L1-like esterase
MKNLLVWGGLGAALLAGAVMGAGAQTQKSAAKNWAAPEATVQDGMRSIESLDRWRETLVPMFMNDYGDLGRYRAADAALGAPKPGEKRVIFFGDSITDIWNLNQYFPGKGYINRGISGQTTWQMLVRFREDVVDLHPAVVVILAGTNDIAGNTGKETLGEIEGDLASMVEIARANGIRVVLSSLTPENGTKPQWVNFVLQRPPQQIVDLNDWIQHYCQQNGLVYLDYYSAMVNSQGLMKPPLTRDGLHPSAAGFAVMAPLAQAAIEKALSLPVAMQK